MYIADLHIHSRYSRATSRDCTPEHLDLWARRRGSTLWEPEISPTPAWREELREKLKPAEDGLYVLKDEYRIEDETVRGSMTPRFVVTGGNKLHLQKGRACAQGPQPDPSAGPGGGRKRSRADWRRSETSTLTGGRSWGSPAMTCWRSSSPPARRAFTCRPTSGRPTFPCSGLFQDLIQWRSALRI